MQLRSLYASHAHVSAAIAGQPHASTAARQAMQTPSQANRRCADSSNSALTLCSIQARAYDVFMDSNWFFSSVAQSVAAIVGILAAFVTSRIITAQAEFSRKRARSGDLVAEAAFLANRFEHASIGWYDMRANNLALSAVRNTLAEGRRFDAKEFYWRMLFSPFSSAAENLEQIQLVIDQWNGAHAANVRQPYESERRESGEETDQANRELRTQLNTERLRINELVIEARRHKRACHEHFADITTQAESSPVTKFAIVMTVLLFFFGVIYPLSFLPLRNGIAVESLTLSALAFWSLLFSLRGLILLIPSVIVLTAAVAALRVNNRLRYSKAELERVEQYTVASGYSKYLESFENNEAALNPHVQRRAA